MLLKADPTFYPSPKLAMQAPQEKVAYVAALNANGGGGPDALVVVDVDAASTTYGKIVGKVEMPNAETNCITSAGMPAVPHCARTGAPARGAENLVVPGLRSSRIHIIDTKPNPREPKIVKVIEPEEVARRTGYSRLHTLHCGPDGIYISALGAPERRRAGGNFCP